MRVDFCMTNETTIAAPECALKALLVAAAGRHNIMLVGSPGCGKTALAQKLPLLTPLPTEEELESVAAVYSAAGIPLQGGASQAPFRSPHQAASLEGMCGGGPYCRPGEISLAHNGILFLDEASEFRGAVLQMLRVPLETRSIVLSRAGRSSIFPADFQLVMAASPCACGNFGSEERICICSEKAVELYWRKFSAPLLDGIDIAAFFDEKEKPAERSVGELREMVAVAFERQAGRGKRNSRLSLDELRAATKRLDGRIAREGFPPKLERRLRAVALTAADIEGREAAEEDLLAAIDLRKPFPHESFADSGGRPSAVA